MNCCIRVCFWFTCNKPKVLSPVLQLNNGAATDQGEPLTAEPDDYNSEFNNEFLV